jgi:hypothetical protein
VARKISIPGAYRSHQFGSVKPPKPLRLRRRAAVGVRLFGDVDRMVEPTYITRLGMRPCFACREHGPQPRCTGRPRAALRKVHDLQPVLGRAEIERLAGQRR